MKDFLFVKLIACIVVCLGIMLLASCGGVTVTPDGDGGVTITPNENQGGNGGGNATTPGTGNENNVIHSHTYKLDTSADGSYSCTEGGVRTWRCVCGESFTEKVEAPGHNIRTYEGKAATCEADGYEPYEKCISGNCDYTTYKVIPALGHDLQHYADVQPTCTTAGVADKAVCKREGCNYSTETNIPALGHLRQVIDGKAATCTENGYYSYEICTRSGCNGDGIAKPVVITALGHDNIDYDAKEPTCTEFGWYAYTVCQRCNYSTYSQRAEIGHTYVNGYCGCGQANLDLHSHIWNEGEVTLSATCTSAGMRKYTCTDTNCGDTKNEVIPALGHDNKSYAAKAATCTAEGWYAYDECQRCGYSTFASIPALGHSYDNGIVTTQPTCTLTGIRTYSCIRCERTYRSEVEKLGHAYGDWYVIKDAECEISGQEQRVCGNDSSHVEIRTVAKLGHSWGEWTVTSKATCVKDGLETRICNNNSSHMETRPVSVVDHTVSTSTGVCSECGGQITARLDTPTVISLNGTVLIWSSVEGADYYEITIYPDNIVLKSQVTTLDLEEYYGVNSVLNIKIRAISPKDSGVVNSAYLEYEYQIPGDPIVNSKGIGSAVNLLKGSYTDFASGTTSIFNDILFNRLRVNETEKRTQNTTIVYQESLQGYVNHLTQSINSKVKVTVSADFFKIAKITSGYSFEVDKNYDRKTYSDTKAVFYDMDYLFIDREVEIAGYNDTEKLSSALSEEFLSDATKVQDGDMTSEQFILKYGTHIVTAGVYGASFNLHYEMLSSVKGVEETFGSDVKAGITNQISASIKGVELGVSTDTSIETKYSAFTSNTSTDQQTKFSVSAVGGDATGMVATSLSEFADICESWASNLENSGNYVLIDVPDGSLFFVWDFLGEEYTEAKNILNNYFYTYCDENYYALKNKISSLYKDSFLFDEETGTLTVNFSGLQNVDVASLEEINYEMNGTSVFDSSTGIFTVFSRYDGIDIKKVVFKGGYYTRDRLGQLITNHFSPFCIKFDKNWSNNIVIELENFGYEAPAGYAALDFSEVESENITVIVNGVAYIKGGDGDNSDGCVAINAFEKNITIEGSGALEVIGGNGVNATNSGGSGMNGGSAIVVNNAVINMAGNLTVTGGNGGNGKDANSTAGTGGNGGDGGNGFVLNIINVATVSSLSVQGGTGGNGAMGGQGYRGTDGSRKDVWYSTAPSGTDGGTGGTGGTGGAGGFAIKILNTNDYSVYIGEGNINLVGGSSGNGGKGGKGGTGGTGGYTNSWYSTGGNGGNGGKGGTGGNAYTGAEVSNVEITSYNENTIISSGNTGEVGTGGDAGDGGAAGKNDGGKGCPGKKDGTPGGTYGIGDSGSIIS